MHLSENTHFCGDFPEIATTVCQMLPAGVAHPQNRLIFKRDASLPAEGYRISCTESDIKVTAADQSGALYAVMTLLQLVGEGGAAKRVYVEDAPHYSWRGFMLDCSRHFWSVEKIKAMLDFMLRIKLNVFHWHLSDDQGWRVEIEKYPLLTVKGCVRRVTDGRDHSGYLRPETVGTEYGAGMFYTKAQVKEIVAYAAVRGITIVPEIDMPGHLSAAIACYPELSCTGAAIEVPDEWGVLHNIGCCGRDEFYTFARDVIDELCELFPGEYFHIGGDEVPRDKWEACPACQKLMKEKNLGGESEIQSYFNTVIAEYLAQKGRRMLGWNEILEGGTLTPENAVVQWWIDSRSDRELAWLRQGGKAVLSALDYVYMDHPYAVRPLEKSYCFTPAVLRAEDSESIMGIEFPQWTEHICNEDKLDLNTNARLLAAAELAWTEPSLKNYADFEARLEALRHDFEKCGILICPRFVYRGETLPAEADSGDRNAYGWNLWRKNPDFELELV